jgi:hypothetical protein
MKGGIRSTVRRGASNFRIAQAIETEGASPLRWQPLEPQGGADVRSTG